MQKFCDEKSGGILQFQAALFFKNRGFLSSTIYDRLGYVTKYSLVWLISVALVYLFGITVAWVIDGFKKANGS